jgi:hypothetical protein
MTASGGANHSTGTVFEITPADKLTTLHNLCSQRNSTGYRTDGELPYAGLVSGPMGISIWNHRQWREHGLWFGLRSQPDRQTDFALQLLFPNQLCRRRFPGSPAGAGQQRGFLWNDGDGRYQHPLTFRQFGSRLRHDLRNYAGGKSNYAPRLLHRERLHRWTISLRRTGAGRQWTPLRHNDLTRDRGNGCGSVFSLAVGLGSVGRKSTHLLNGVSRISVPGSKILPAVQTRAGVRWSIGISSTPLPFVFVRM